MPFQGPTIQKLPGGCVSVPPTKPALHAKMSLSLPKFTATCLYPPKTNGLATPDVQTELSFYLWKLKDIVFHTARLGSKTLTSETL